MLSEFELIARYFTHATPGTVLGVGDDAALVRPASGMELAVSVDMLVAGRHFYPDADPLALGHKSLAVNLSDLAAMGAQPRWATLALALPRPDPAWARAFARGFMRLARRHGVDLIGGDTTAGPLTICVQIMGEVPRGKALRRDGARRGHDVWISGRTGEAALALAARERRVKLSAAERAACERRLNVPVPRVTLGLALRGIAHAAIDVSDGLAADLGHICERSHVGAEIELALLPASGALRRLRDQPLGRDALLAGGDDYELCFTAPQAARARVLAAARRARVPVTRIGRIVAARTGKAPVTVADAAGKPVRLSRTGYDHFR